ncbi:hypothetical protein [Shewanella maritima]|uniref:hypothetical protein n=1 Tax=Shewanella maritima TaxID=2520507 RepID=UPI003735A019
MAISNAKRWSEICEMQVNILEGLRRQFPQRGEQIENLACHWQALKHQVDNNPSCIDRSLFNEMLL